MAFGLTSLTSLFANPGVQAIGAGLLSGVVGGTVLVASGVIPVGGSSGSAATIELLACPNVGPPLAKITDGGRLLVTGRSADGTWLEVYIGQPGIARAWVPTTSLTLESPADALPVAGCEAPAPGPLPSPVTSVAPSTAPSAGPQSAAPSSVVATPGATPSTATAKPGASPTKAPTTKPPSTKAPVKTATPPPAATATPTPDTEAPSLSGLTTTGSPGGNGDYYINGPSSSCQPHSATVSVDASDPSGVASVTLYYWPGGSGVLSTAMSPAGGTTWAGTITAQDGWSDTSSNGDPNGLISYWVIATDTAGNSRQLDYSNSYRLYSNGVCLF